MSLSLNLGQKSGTDLSNSLLPEQTNLSDWLTQATTDGKTLVNVKGTDTTLTGINSIAVTSGDTITITGLSSSASVSSVASGSVTPTVSSDTLTFGSSGFCSNIVLSDGTHLPLAEGSGTKVFDISGNGNHGTLSGTSWTTTNSIASHNHQYGFTGNSSLKVPVLINKTKQAITLDGSNDVIGFGSTITVTDFVYTSKFKLETTAGNNNVFFSSGSDTSSAMFMTLDGSRLAFQIGGNLIQNFPDGSGDGSDTAQRFIVAGYKTSASQTGTVNLRDGNVHTVVLTRSGTTIAVDIDDGTATGTFINMPTDAMTFTQFGKQMTGGSCVKGTIYSSKLESGGSVVHEFNLEENIGTTTIKDSSTNSNDGTLSNATLSSAWGQRIVDSSGTIVPACYASGATEITNPSEYVHNGSECSFDLVTSDLSTADRNVIVNSTATRDFLKRDNSKQGYNTAGSFESVHFNHSLNASSDFEFESEFIVNDPTVSLQAIFSATGSTTNDRGMFIRYELSSTRWLIKLGDTTYTITSHSISRGDKYLFNIKYHSSTQKTTVTMTKNGVTTTPIDNQDVSNVPDFNGQASLSALRWSSSYSDFTFKTCKFIQGTTTNVELDISNSAGLSTIADLSGNGNNGALQNATVANSWASGNLAKQLLQYTGNLSDAGELARTRAYVS